VPPPQERPRTPEQTCFVDPIQDQSESSPRPAESPSLRELSNPEVTQESREQDPPVNAEENDSGSLNPSQSHWLDEPIPGSRHRERENKSASAWDPSSRLYENSEANYQRALEPKPGE
jgi:hypothetical protein